MGYPIVNDPLYGPHPKVESLPEDPADNERDASEYADLMLDVRQQFSKLEALPTHPWVDPDCPECWINFVDPRPEELRIDLHCWKYAGPGWKFHTELPLWAKHVKIDAESCAVDSNVCESLAVKCE